MKTFKTTLLLIAITFMAISFGFAQVGDKYQFGYSTLVEVESADTINLEPKQAVTVYKVTADTNVMVVNATSAYAGYRFSLIVESADPLILRFGNSIFANEYNIIPINEGETKTLEFISSGTNWYMTSVFTMLDMGRGVEITDPVDTLNFAVLKPMMTTKLTADTNNLVINAPINFGGDIFGYRAAFIITALDTVTVKFNTNITGADIIINEGDKKAFELVNWGSDWFLVGD